ncbi:hypothetical protein TPL01_30000 [Sulfuriferula plumbiphila]|uniref:Uncharacterized protein n=1 Tax=Sulfuriferula plumbiphila TaxID=171865 RepID=A0A512LBV2_9PROT|nr:YfdX family protein [Sulfuriferula plumbiphila]BBP05786.1 hypothetical protein SFPGR_32080 [Sulfuriferula plumbiphila]GEP31862.1 hypothetical protein TPL01_30000 [Sulfuriferula plumbiphila]
MPESIMHTFTCRPPIIAMLLGSALTSAWGAATPARQQAAVGPGQALSIRQQDRLSDIAVQALHQIAAARADIARRDASNAHQALDNANALLNTLQASLPTPRDADRIGIAQKHLGYEDGTRVLPDLVPIYADLHALQDFIPVQSAQAHPGKAHSHPQQGQKQPGADALRATDAALIYAEADLPLAHTRRAVDTARLALDQDDWQGADNALKNAEDGVVFMSVSVSEPLAAGRQSLQQTTHLLAAGETARARVELQRARSCLQHAAQTTDSVARTKVNTLLQDTSQLDRHIRNGNANVVRDAQTLWYRTAALAERSSAYLGNAWARVMHDQPIKSRLIEARLSLRNAAIDQFTAHRPAAVEAALTHTQNYLHQALQIARTDNQPQTEIRGIQQHIARLAATPPPQRKQEQFSQLASELSILISQS